MTESVEKGDNYFKYPDIQNEFGEFERVGKTFGIDSSALIFLAEQGELVTISDDIWSKLENTDSNSVEFGNWDAVHDHSNPNDEFKRDWESLRAKMESGKTLDAPIIMKFGERYHLVSGNTRLMISRAKGIAPKVLIFEIDQSFESQ